MLCAWRLRHIAPAEAARDAIGFTRAAWKFETIALRGVDRACVPSGERVLALIAVAVEGLGDASV